ncbi:hypothetical protein MTO96_003917 [Rhipicephalus appendiculatus]
MDERGDSREKADMAAYAAIAPVFKAAYQGVKTLYSGSANPPAAAPSTSSQVNQGKVDQPATSPMVAGSSSGFANVGSHIERFIGFTVGANPPVVNSLVNLVGPPSHSTNGNALISCSQGNQSEVVKAPTSPEESASSSGLANFRSQVHGFSSGAIEKAAEKIPFHDLGPLKTVSANKPQKEDDTGKPKQEKRKKKQGSAKPSKHVKGDDS